MNILFFLKYGMSQASSRVRGFYIAEALNKRQIHTDISYGLSKYLNALWTVANYDIIYIQKCYFNVDIALNRFARQKKKKTVFDIDDAPSGIARSSKKQKQAIEMIKQSSIVVVGSRKLKEFAEKFNAKTFLIPSSINLSYYQPQEKAKETGSITLGWIGYGVNYKNDLSILVKPIEKIGQNHKIKLVLIGAYRQKEIYNNFRRIKNVEVEIIDTLNWADPYAAPRAISRFDIGLYPLLDNEYNQYKCGFKALEYMALGVPTVASPVGETNFVIENSKDGFFAAKEKDWEEILTYLIEREDIRKSTGKQGREKVERFYSTDACANDLLKVFES